ncbi:MAG: hypothetical protein AB7P69_28475 [Candidatus Binatia bacterium]
MRNDLSYILEVYGRLSEIEQESIHTLSEAQAFHFVELANDWIDIQMAIGHTYSRDELTQSLVFTYFLYLFKEVQWFQLHFLSGNYPLLGRGLRFVWEMIYRAYYTDTYAGESQPGPSLDDKIVWLEERESTLGWGNCICPVLGKVFPLAEQEQEVREHYHQLWQRLNRYVHPSVELVSRMMGESALLVTDSFDETWATEIIQDATEVFGLIWLAVISRFPKCARLLAQQEHGLVCPLTQSVLKGMSSAD